MFKWLVYYQLNCQCDREHDDHPLELDDRNDENDGGHLASNWRFIIGGAT